MKYVIAVLALLLGGCTAAQAQALHTATIHEGEGTTPVPCDATASQPVIQSWVNSTGRAVGVTFVTLGAFPPDGGIVYARLVAGSADQVDTADVINKFAGYYSDTTPFPSQATSFAPFYYEVLPGGSVTLRLACLAPVGTTGGGMARLHYIFLN